MICNVAFFTFSGVHCALLSCLYSVNPIDVLHNVQHNSVGINVKSGRGICIVDVLLLFSACFLVYTPLVLWFSPVPGNMIYVGAVGLFIILHAKFLLSNVRGLRLCSLFAGVMIAVASVPAFYWGEIKLAFFSIYVILAVFAWMCIGQARLIYFIELSSSAMSIIAIGAIIGMFYALGGGQPIFSQPFNNREGYLYLTTFTSAVIGNYIRPAGIFDEPGTLSYAICLVAAVRHFLGLGKRTTWFLLISGFSTMSLAHLAYALCHLLEDIKGGRRFRVLIAISFVVIVLYWVGSEFSYFNEMVKDVFLSRLEVDEGKLAGDSRSELIKNAIDYLDLDSFLFGLDISCMLHEDICSIKYARYGENPLSLVLEYGIFLSWPYYAIQTLLLYVSIKKKSFVGFGIFLILLQRPNTMAYGTALLVIIVIMSFIGAKISSHSYLYGAGRLVK